MKRKEALDAAAACVTKDREAQYGPPEDNFRKIAAYWSAYLGIDLTTTDVAAMMVLLKMGRVTLGMPPKDDTWVDAAGYAACGAELGERLKATTIDVDALTLAKQRQCAKTWKEALGEAAQTRDIGGDGDGV